MHSTRISAISALQLGCSASFAHWRVLLLWWLAGLVPAFWLTRQVANAAHALFAYHPDAMRIISEPDFAALADAVLAHDRVITQLTLDVLPPLLLTAMLAPWAAGIAVTGLRASKPPGFIALILGGLREYAPQLRLYLLALLPLLLTLPVAVISLSIADMKATQAITYSQAAPWHYGARGFSALLVLLPLASIEAGRAAFAADPALRSALLALSRGWRLIYRRFFAWLGICSLTWAAGLAAGSILHASGQLSGNTWLALACTQVAVTAIGWSRLARLAALQRLLPKSGHGR
ncbi:hypothetical protein CO610_02720 [Lysobacteraceae bacterium NML95-0200]|nr:hypothetical protein CO610_02720 [Xanthomonadaceae bacterium NML95-0200]